MNEPTDIASFIEWVTEQGSKLSLPKAERHLKEILGVDPAREYVDIERELETKLGRALSAEERFAMRPIIAQFDDYYEEE